MTRRQDVSPGRSPPGVSDGRRLDRMFAALSKPRRRHVLRCLVESPEPLTVPELARRVVREGRASNAAGAPAGSAGREHASLYHVDLPKLVNAGLVDHDPETGRVRLADRERCPEIGVIVELLTTRDARERP